ncbi:hypothetical protein J7J26_01510 [Candidatus Micrarchaeota archaeon]|nr:hypothetical protein [Candidatus Micrarchaeota archaeon]
MNEMYDKRKSTKKKQRVLSFLILNPDIHRTYVLKRMNKPSSIFERFFRRK